MTTAAPMAHTIYRRATCAFCEHDIVDLGVGWVHADSNYVECST